MSGDRRLTRSVRRRMRRRRVTPYVWGYTSITPYVWGYTSITGPEIDRLRRAAFGWSE